MASSLADIFGTEDDVVNCPFYLKIGACRHGDKCTRVHNKPTVSETILIKNMYQNPPVSIAIAEGQKISKEGLKQSIRHFEDFYEDVYLEFCNFGKIEDMQVLDNLGDHLIGNVYIVFSSEEEAKNAMTSLSGKYFNKKPLIMEYSPVSQFKDSRCRQYDIGNCDRGAFCNFMHLKYISRSLKKSLFNQMLHDHPEYNKSNREKDYKKRSRNKSPSQFSDLGEFDSRERMRIIKKWADEVEEKLNHDKLAQKSADAKIEFHLLQKKLQEKYNIKYD